MIKTDVPIPSIPVAAPVNVTSVQKTIHTDEVASSPPSEASIAPTGNKFLGYAVIAQLADETGALEERWFEIEGKHDALMPTQNEIVILNADKAIIRSQPYHWDLKNKKHVVSEPVMTMSKGQKARIGGDCLIVKDETNDNAWYIIAPLSEIIGLSMKNESLPYPPVDLADEVKGYVYLGYLNKNETSLSDKSFENFSSPDALYPSPNDVLIAKSDIWLRQGPRRWDVERRLYNKPQAVAAIHKGDYVSVAGDISLARGIALWVPISKRSPLPKLQPPEKNFWEKFQNVFKQDAQK